MLAAIKAPRTFEKLVFVAPSPCFINDEHYTGGFSRSDIEDLLALMDENFFGWSANIAPLIMGNADKPQFTVELTASFCRTQPEIAKHFARVTFLSDTREQLRLLRQPALILQCARDAIAPEAVGHFMHRQLLRSNLVLMQAEGHCPHMSAPEETIAAIKRFLQDAT
jgi:sigma-B regulation protein RsbQ